MSPASQSTYATIPISNGNPISLSLSNLLSYYSINHKPWPEFLSTAAFRRPENLSGALSRLRTNAICFRVNYAVLILSIALISLIQWPLSLLVVAAILAGWLLLYFFREDPLVVFDRGINDRTVLIGLVVITLAGLWLTAVVATLVGALGIGVLIMGVHAIFRESESLYMNEEEAVSEGLIGSRKPDFV
ncbi:hypothetical protein AMTRI_Chr10g233390 [Amborella trichopoda]